MAITYDEDSAVFEGMAGVEEVEGLLQWVQEHAGATADLSACTHLHAAHVQVLMAGHIPVAAWPRDPGLKEWLTSALSGIGH